MDDLENLDQVPTDIENMEKFHLEVLKFNRNQIIKTIDPTMKQLKDQFDAIKKELKLANENPNRPVLLNVYASCHGILEDTTKIVLNDEVPARRYFDLEYHLEVFSRNFKNNFIFAVFDCCR